MALDLLTWLVAQGRIEIKVAFVQEGHRIFHEKERHPHRRGGQQTGVLRLRQRNTRRLV